MPRKKKNRQVPKIRVKSINGVARIGYNTAGSCKDYYPILLPSINIENKIYDLLPHARIFFCFAGNASEYAMSVQNRLLLRNLRPVQNIAWEPMAWNVIADINVHGKPFNVQDVINTFIAAADYIIFLVNEEMGEDTKVEWEYCTKQITGKQIYLGLSENSDKAKLRKELDPEHQQIYFMFRDSSDILSYIDDYITPNVTIVHLEDKLSLVKSKRQLEQFTKVLTARIKMLKENNVNIHFIEPYIRQLERIKATPKHILCQTIRPSFGLLEEGRCLNPKSCMESLRKADVVSPTTNESKL